MAVNNGYCQTADLRSWLADGSSQLTTALLERAINAASRAIDRYCGRRFWLDASVSPRVYKPPCGRLAFIDDIGDLTGLVVEMGSDGVNFPSTLVADTDFRLEPKTYGDFPAFAFNEVHLLGGRRFYTHHWYPTNGTLRVTAKWGWSAIPDEVTEACLIKAAALFKRKDAVYGVAGFNDFGAVRISPGDVDVVDLLAPFKIQAFA